MSQLILNKLYWLKLNELNLSIKEATNSSGGCSDDQEHAIDSAIDGNDKNIAKKRVNKVTIAYIGLW